MELGAATALVDPEVAPLAERFDATMGAPGWRLDSLEVPLQRLSSGAEVSILSLDYALAPEHVFPVALEQCEDAVAWAAGHADDLGVSEVLAIGGDSAGGNLAALRRGWPRPASP